MKSNEVDDMRMAELGDVIDRARERQSTAPYSVPPAPRSKSSKLLAVAATVLAVGAAGVVLSTRGDSSTTLVPGTEAQDTSVATTAPSADTPTTIDWDLTACSDQLDALVKQVPSIRDLRARIFKDLDGDGITWPACEVYLGDDPQTIQVGISSQPVGLRGPTGDDDETSERVLSTATLYLDVTGSPALPNAAQAYLTFDDGLTVWVKAHNWPTDFDVRSTAIDLAETLTGAIS